MTKPVNYIGHKIGMIEVTGRAENDSGSATRWYVTCECGKEGVIIYGNRIQKGQDHCGCQFTGFSKMNHERAGKQKTKREVPATAHPVINEFLYRHRGKYAHLRTDQWSGPLPEARYCQIPPPAPPEGLEVYLRGLR